LPAHPLSGSAGEFSFIEQWRNQDMPDRPDSRTPAQKSGEKYFKPIMAKPPVDPDATEYDTRIAEVEQEIKKHNIATPDGFLAWLKESRNDELAARDMAEMDKQYHATMMQHQTVQRLLLLKSYYEQDTSVDAKWIRLIDEAVEQFTTPGADRDKAEEWANGIFTRETERVAAIEGQLNAESAKWNERASQLQQARQATAAIVADTASVEAKSPVSFEKSIKLKSSHPLAAAYEIWLELPADSKERAEVDFALDRKAIPGVIDAVIEKYRYVPAAATENDSTVAADAEQGGE
jgi:hypothetical protein